MDKPNTYVQLIEKYEKLLSDYEKMIKILQAENEESKKIIDCALAYEEDIDVVEMFKIFADKLDSNKNLKREVIKLLAESMIEAESGDKCFSYETYYWYMLRLFGKEKANQNIDEVNIECSSIEKNKQFTKTDFCL